MRICKWLRLVLFSVVLMLEPRGVAAAEPDSAAIAKLIRQLSSQDFITREAAGRDLVAIGKPAVAALEAATKSTDAEVARRAAKCLVDIAARLKVEGYLRDLDSPEASIRLNALHEMAQLPVDPHVAAGLPKFIRLLDHPDHQTRRSVISALGVLGPEARGAVPGLVKVLQDDANPMVRYAVCHALSKVGGKEAKEAIPLLVKLADVKERDVNLRFSAAHALACLGKGNERAFAAIFAMCSEDDKRVKGMAAAHLGRLGMHPKKCVPLMVDFLKENPDFPGRIIPDGPVLEPDNTPDPRLWCITGLASFGPAAREAVPVLRDMMNNETDYHRMRCHCLRSLVPIWGDEAIPELIKVVQSGSERTRSWAIQELGAMGPRARAALPALRAVNKQLSADVKQAIKKIEE